MSKWRKYNGALIPETPPHIEIKTSKIKAKIKETNSYFARWTTEFDCKKVTEFWHVICDQNLEIEEYSVNTRSKITFRLASTS